MGLFRSKQKLGEGEGGKEMHPSSGAPFARSVGLSGPKVYLRFGVSAALLTPHQSFAGICMHYERDWFV